MRTDGLHCKRVVLSCLDWSCFVFTCFFSLVLSYVTMSCPAWSCFVLLCFSFFLSYFMLQYLAAPGLVLSCGVCFLVFFIYCLMLPCLAAPPCASPCPGLFCLPVFCLVSYLTLPCLVTLCLALSWLVLFCLAVFFFWSYYMLQSLASPLVHCLVLLGLVLSCRVLSCLILEQSLGARFCALKILLLLLSYGSYHVLSLCASPCPGLFCLPVFCLVLYLTLPYPFAAPYPGWSCFLLLCFVLSYVTMSCRLVHSLAVPGLVLS